MAVFIELTTDSFRDVFATTAAGQRNAHVQYNPYGRAGSSSVRRPLRGLEIKDDTYALIRVIQANGREIPLVDSGAVGGTATNYSNFILQSVQESRMEKHQIIETFGEPYIFFFGEAPSFLDVQAILLNSEDFNWEAEWWFNYENYFRGTKSVELGARTYLFYDDNIVEGYMLQAQAVKMADQPLMMQLSFRLFVTNSQNISFVGDTNFPIRSEAGGLQLTLTSALNGEQLNQLAAEGAGISSQLINGQPIANSAIQRSIPLRGLISDNMDEWTGEITPAFNPPGLDSATSEVDDLHQAAFDALDDYGVDESGPDTMQDLGLGPTFQNGTGIGFGAGASLRATFGATARVSVAARASFNFSASASTSASASYGGGVGAGAVVAVGGRPTAFALVSTRGTLNRSGTARAQASASVGFGF